MRDNSDHSRPGAASPPGEAFAPRTYQSAWEWNDDDSPKLRTAEEWLEEEAHVDEAMSREADDFPRAGILRAIAKEIAALRAERTQWADECTRRAASPPAGPEPKQENTMGQPFTTEEIVANHGNPVWDTIWETIKKWDIRRDPEALYSDATGDDVQRIFLAVQAARPAAGPAGGPDEPIKRAMVAARDEAERWLRANPITEPGKPYRLESLVEAMVQAGLRAVVPDAPGGETT